MLAIRALLLMFVIIVAKADNALLIFGASRHLVCNSHKNLCHFNEFNPGLGIEWATPEHFWGQALLRIGGYYDSRYSHSHFASIGLRKQLNLNASLSLGAGLLVGYLDGPGKNGLAALPFVSVGWHDTALEIGYVPNMNIATKRHAFERLITFNLRWQWR